jgi:hypothetical protein
MARTPGSDDFDAFYKDARSRLLLQTYALTGDLRASTIAVRHGFIVAWHHWGKWSRTEDPEQAVRPLCWRIAQRRHTGRLWRRDKSLGPDGTATLEALGKLSLTERRVLLLNELTVSSLADLAREVALTQTEAERTLQLATSKYALQRQVSTTGIRATFVPLEPVVADARWPRSTIIRRQGASRRRGHTFAGALGALAIFLGSGLAVTAASSDAPLAAPEQGHPAASNASSADLPEDALLTTGQVSGYLPLARGATWSQRTQDNLGTHAKALMPCQGSAFGGRRPEGALTRVFRDGSGGQVVQILQRSKSPAAARQAYTQMAGWLGQCDRPTTQLVSTRTVGGVGDRAMLVGLRQWGKAPQTWSAGLARSGELVSATFTQTPAKAPAPSPSLQARLLAASINGSCTGPYGGHACAGAPRLHTAPPMPVPGSPAMLDVIDLPPISGVTVSWTGTDTQEVTSNAAATNCDSTSFTGNGVSGATTRTFVMPDTGAPDVFGLTETVARVQGAPGFVDTIRSKLARCSDDSLASTVTRLDNQETADRDIAIWRVTSELNDKQKFTILMGVARVGDAVAQVGFVPGKGYTMASDDFVALVRRAGDRVGSLRR